MLRVIFMATKKIEDGIRSYLNSVGASRKPVVDREAVKPSRLKSRRDRPDRQASAPSCARGGRDLRRPLEDDRRRWPPVLPGPLLGRGVVQRGGAGSALT